MSAFNEEQHVEYPNQRRLCILAVLAALFVAAGVFLMLSESPRSAESIMSIVIGAASISFFGLCLCCILIKMIRKEPSFVLNGHGFYDASSYTAAGSVDWKDVDDIFMYEIGGQQMIGVKLRDEKTFFERQNGVKRRLMTINSHIAEATVSIPQASVSLPLERLYAMMLQRWKHVKGHRSIHSSNIY